MDFIHIKAENRKDIKRTKKKNNLYSSFKKFDKLRAITARETVYLADFLVILQVTLQCDSKFKDWWVQEREVTKKCNKLCIGKTNFDLSPADPNFIPNYGPDEWKGGVHPLSHKFRDIKRQKHIGGKFITCFHR